MEDMNVKLWERLPSGILERTLSCLSAPVLCRFRTVCKRWNSLICTTEFGALCLQQARREACFLVARYAIFMKNEDKPLGQDHGWSFMDVNARRWYTIAQDGQAAYDSFPNGPFVAMDGGLVCQMFLHGEPDPAVIVTNPIARTSTFLPSFPDVGLGPYEELDMVVDNLAHFYKVFVMPNGYRNGWFSEEEPLMVVFDSRTNQWKNSAIPRLPQTADDNFLPMIWEVISSVFCNGLLYILMYPDPESCGVAEGKISPEFWLWSYNHIEDTWNETGVDLDDKERRRGDPRLVASGKRLFLGSWLSKRSSPLDDQRFKGPWSYEILEVDVVERTCTTVFQMTGDVMAEVFDVSADCLDDCDKRERHVPFFLATFGFGKSIVLFSVSFQFKSGVSMIIDLSTWAWEYLPTNPLTRLKEKGDDGVRVLRFGSPMNLILPASTVWVEHEPDAGTQGVQNSF